MSLFERLSNWKKEQRERNYTSRLITELITLMGGNPDSISQIDLLTVLPFIYADKKRNYATYLFKNSICEIETLIYSSYLISLGLDSSIKNRIDKRIVKNKYLSNTKRLISNKYQYNFEKINELLNTRFEYYNDVFITLYPEFKQIILISQDANEFIHYSLDSPIYLITRRY